jgi:hypothetical protein
MGQFKNLDEPKPTFDKPWYDPHFKIKKISDDYIRIDPNWFHLPGPGPGPIKFDVPEGLLPFVLTMPHQYNANPSKEDTQKVSVEMYDSMIQQAEYQIDMLKAHVESLNKQRERLKGFSEE